MVLMGMRDHDAEQAVVRLPKPRDFGQQLFLPLVGRVERQADVECDALTLRFDLDAGAARSPWCPGGYAASPAASLQQFRSG